MYFSSLVNVNEFSSVTFGCNQKIKNVTHCQIFSTMSQEFLIELSQKWGYVADIWPVNLTSYNP